VAALGEMAGQSRAIALLEAAASGSFGSAAEETAPGVASAMTHSWLITGPPGSGRSNLAFAFAAALLSPAAVASNAQSAAGSNAQSAVGTGPTTPGIQSASTPDAATARMVAARTHPDLAVLSTDRVVITIEEVRQLVASSHFSPSVGRHRVMVIEDADRMSERTSNVLLKALEEPPERTVWILCAPSEADLIPTIRSRVRTVRLSVPTIDEVARLLHSRDGIDPATALTAARQAQSHIGMALRLATSTEARERRAKTLDLALGVHTVSDAVTSASALLELAREDAEAITDQRDGLEREAARHSLGIEPGAAVPAGLRGQLRTLEDDQKRRATRSLRDGIDRILVDLLALYRDILLLQLTGEPDLVNLDIRDRLVDAAARADPAETLASMEAVVSARRRIEANVAPALALEAMLCVARRPLAAHSQGRQP